jgi:integrase
VRKPAPAATEEVRPLPPATVEAIRAVLSPRHALLISLLAYSGVRPQEGRGLHWGTCRSGRSSCTPPRPAGTARSRGRCACSLRLPTTCASGGSRPAVPPTARQCCPGQGGGGWTEVAYEQWRARVWAKALDDVGLPYQRPYDLRHSFASLLLHEGRSVIHVARQLGHSAALTMSDYGHVIEELEDQPRVSAEDAIAAARRGSDVRTGFGRGG